MAMLNKSLYSIIFFISILIGQNTKPTVAILDFEGQGVDASEVKTLSERMRTEIGNTNAVRLIERKAVEKTMMEQGLQQSGCTTDECAAEVGQLLGVQFMISGSIGKMGKSYTIDCKMFSVETGETVRTKSATHKGDVSGLLTEMEILAWEIVGLNAPQRLKLKRAGTEATRTVAVLDFEGRGITMQEAQTLTDRFTTSLSSTNKVVMVERGTMNDVLKEQGFDSGECTSDECAAEVGAMLGVEYMISGSIGKIGNAYTIDAKMFSVSTGAAESMKSITYAGAGGITPDHKVELSLGSPILSASWRQGLFFNYVQKHKIDYNSFEEVEADTTIMSQYEEYIYASDLDIFMKGESNYLDMKDMLWELDSTDIQIQGAIEIIDSYFEQKSLTQFETESDKLYHWLLVEFADYFHGDEGRVKQSATQDKDIQKAIMILQDPVVFGKVLLPQLESGTIIDD